MDLRLRSLMLSALLLSMVGPMVPNLCAQADSRLPDGTQFPFWERPFTPSKTYYVNGTTGKDKNPGTKDRPFKTIDKAAQVLEPGERVVIASGIYREYIDPARGGTGPDKLISYEAAPGANVIVSGAEVVKHWTPATGLGFRRMQNGTAKIYQTKLNGAWFGGYNPFGMVNLPQQKGFLVSMHNHLPGAPGYNMPWLAETINLATYYRRRGLVFADGKPLTQVDSYMGLFSHVRGFGPRSSRKVNATIVEQPQNHLFEEFGGSAGRVFIANDGLTLYIRLNHDGNPNDHLMEITTKETVFRPSRRYLAYIRIKGIHFEMVGNGFPMPQIGMVSTNRGNHWIFEDDSFEWANSIGLDIGDEAWDASPPPQQVGYDVVRGNVFRYCGIEGLSGAGTPGGIHDVLIEKNLFEWIGWQHAAGMSESAAMKLHVADGLLFRENVVRHIRHANGIWLDTFNSNDRITRNIFADIPGEINPQAVHIEASSGTNEVDNNIFYNLTGGVLIRDTNNLIVANNLFMDCRIGVTMTTGLAAPRLVGGSTVDGVNNRIYNNVFHQMRRSAIEFTTPTNSSDGNVFSEMPRWGGYLKLLGPTQFELNSVPQQWLNLKTWQQEHGWDKNGKLADIDVSFNPDTLKLTLKYPSSVVKVPVFDHLTTDYFGKPTGTSRLPGPFAEANFENRNVDLTKATNGAGSE
ncbi:MAG: right-handed parallel beta-helix repeat-containing protein [Candidatus Acidiferrales bacterium]